MAKKKMIYEMIFKSDRQRLVDDLYCGFIAIYWFAHCVFIFYIFFLIKTNASGFAERQCHVTWVGMALAVYHTYVTHFM